MTPEPTPAGPTPTPSFVRPTPTPQPTFFVYTVVRGDNLNRIAKLHGTDGRSIAYWNRLAYPSLDPDSSQYRPNYLVVGWMLQLIPNTVVDPEDLPPGGPTPAARLHRGTGGDRGRRGRRDEAEEVEESAAAGGRGGRGARGVRRGLTGGIVGRCPTPNPPDRGSS